MLKNLYLLLACSFIHFAAAAQSNYHPEIEVQAVNESIFVSWEADTPVPIVLFEVHKLNSNLEWTLVQAVNFVEGETRYRVGDYNPNAGLNSYRLKAIQPSGQPSYSQIVEIQFQPLEFEVLIYPNPANNWIVVNADKRGTNFTAELVNRYGNMVTKSESRNGSLVLDTSQVLEGQYFIKVEGGGTSYNKSVVINHR